MSNYPPGVSAGTPNAPWNAPDMSHDHEWVKQPPEIIDSRLVFEKLCEWEKPLNVEKGYRGERIVTDSIPCEETKTVAYYPSYIRYPNGHGAPVTPLWEDGPWPVEMESAIIGIERAFEDGEIDPAQYDWEHQETLHVEWGDWKLIYRKE